MRGWRTTKENVELNLAHIVTLCVIPEYGTFDVIATDTNGRTHLMYCGATERNAQVEVEQIRQECREG